MGKCFQDGFTFPNCASRVLLSSPTLEMTSLNSSTALQFSAMLVFLIRKVSLRSPTWICKSTFQILVLGQDNFLHIAQDYCKAISASDCSLCWCLWWWRRCWLWQQCWGMRMLMAKWLLTSSLRFRSRPLASLSFIISSLTLRVQFIFDDNVYSWSKKQWYFHHIFLS